MKPENIIRIKKTVFMIGVVAMALAAGAAGAALVANAVIGSLSFSSSLGAAPVAVQRAAKSDTTKVGLAEKGTVALYKNRTGATPLDKIFLPADRVGVGVVLTSDGWIVVPSADLLGHNELAAVFADKTSLSLDPSKAVRDDATGLSFVKIAARDLSVASFGDDTVLQSTDPVFSVGPDAVVSAAVLAQRSLPIQVKIDYVESTQQLGRRITIDRSGSAGAAVVNGSGDMVGLDMGDGTVVPASFITEVLRELFKSGKIVRPNVGAHFVSLDNLPDARDAGLAVSGALVTGGGKYRATEKGSAAETAGLKEGDVITFVEHDRINNEVTLAERLQDYAPGAQIQLTVVRAGKEIKLPLTLK